MKLKLLGNRVYTEHSYVQYPILEVTDDGTYKIFDTLRQYLINQGIENMYFNHYVIAGVDDNNNPVYIGYNDGKLSVGSEFAKMPNAKEYKFIQRRLTLKL